MSNKANNELETYKSLAEYCFDMAERSRSRAPVPPRAVSKVGLAAVVMIYECTFVTLGETTLYIDVQRYIISDLCLQGLPIC